MLNIWFIRHAQSQANAGERTADPALIELTALGKEQGSHVAGLFNRAPEMLVASPYLRARQTAQFVADKHPAVPFMAHPYGLSAFRLEDGGRACYLPAHGRL